MKYCTALFAFLMFVVGAQAQGVYFEQTSYATTDKSTTHLPYDGDLTLTRTNDFSIEYTDAALAEMPMEARDAVLRATQIWSNVLDTDVTLQLRIDWHAYANDDVLATNGATYFKIGDEDVGAREDAYYAAPLAEHIGIPAEYDYTRLNVRINASHHATGVWHYDPDTRPDSSQYDLTQAILKEIGRTIGLTSSVHYRGPRKEVRYGLGTSRNRLPAIYDYYVYDQAGIALTDFTMGTYQEALYDYCTSGTVQWVAPEVVAELYSDNPFAQDVNWAKSITCLDNDTYAGTYESLMKAFQMKGEQVHYVGPLTKAMLRTIGWDITVSDRPGEYETETEHLPAPFTSGGGFTAYPNPTADQLYVEWGEISDKATTISIVHIQSRSVVYQDSRPSRVATSTFDLRDQRSGYYQVILANADGIVLDQRTVYRQ